MGAAYYIALDIEQPGFDTYVNGKPISYDREGIISVAKQLNLPGIDELTSFAKDVVALDIKPDSPWAKERWFDASKGLSWVRAVRDFVSQHPESVKVSNRVIEGLTEYEGVLEKAAKIGARWHFEIDY